MINTNPFFTVIIPTYNRIGILYKALDSVISQTFTDFELIIVDNGSTDSTGNWLRSNYKDQRIRYIYQEGTGSPAGPRNKGISSANGQWICFLDSDDLWDFNKLEIVKERIEQYNDSDVFCHNETLIIMGKESDKVLKYGPYTNDFYKDLLIEGNKLSPSATCVRRSFLINNKLLFNESSDYIIVEDYDLWLRIANRNAKFTFINASLGKYIVNDNNLSANTARLKYNTISMLSEHVYHIQDFDKDKDRLWKTVNFRFNMQNVKSEFERGSYKKSLSFFLYHCFSSPFGVLHFTKYLFKKRLVSLLTK